MARQPRVDAPGAIHHVWTRGVERRRIFLDDDDRLDLRERLETVLPESGACLFAWCFLSNHLHGVIQSGECPIGNVLRRLFTGYALRFNRRQERFGYLFQGRFGSRRIVDDASLRVAIRYVHRNPLDAGLVEHLDDLERYAWCGHGALVGARSPLSFEAPAAALGAFGESRTEAQRSLRSWMDAPPSEAAADPDAGSEQLTEIMGTLARAVCCSLGAGPHLLDTRYRKGRRASEARSIVAFVAVDELGLRTKDVAASLGVTPAAITQARRTGRIRFHRLGWSPESLRKLLNS